MGILYSSSDTVPMPNDVGFVSHAMSSLRINTKKSPALTTTTTTLLFQTPQLHQQLLRVFFSSTRWRPAGERATYHTIIMGRVWIGSAVVLAVAVGVALLFQSMPPHRDLDWDGTVVPMAQALLPTAYPSLSSASSSSSSSSSTGGAPPSGAQPVPPLQGLRVVVTGATNGIGLSLTRALTKLGATVIAVGRSEPRLKALVAELGSDKVIAVQADLEDLHSVARAAEELMELVDRVDILVNNAGIIDKVSIDTLLGWKNFSTPQGFDRVFAVNFLSHVLWTEKLLPVLRHSERPAVVHITSSFHWAVDGTDLVPESGGLPPVAARPGGSHGFFLYRTQRSYANSKLAQIYHSRSLQQRHPDLVVRSVCPAWVGTQIAGTPGSFAHRVMHTVGYPVDGWGLASILQAILSLEPGNSDYYSNSDFFNLFHHLFGQLPSWTYTYGIRDVMGHMGATLAMVGQHFYTHAAPSRSSPESYQSNRGDALYDWSLRVVAPYIEGVNA